MPSERETGHLEYADYLAGTRQLLEQSMDEREPYEVVVAGKSFIVRPGVFSPKYFHDTEVFAEHLPVSTGEEMLEIGPGTGALAVTAKDKGARHVVAIDINPEAVKNTLENVSRYHMQNAIDVRQGDLYQPIQETERFDTIFWNTPFGLVDEKTKLTNLEKAVFDPGYHATQRFVAEASQHLKPHGRLLIGFSSTLGRLDLLQKFCEKANFDLHLLFQQESEEVHPVKFEIFEAKPK